MMKLYENEKSRTDIVRKYNLTASALHKWIKNLQASGSFAAKGNRTEDENELKRELKQKLLQTKILQSF